MSVCLDAADGNAGTFSFCGAQEQLVNALRLTSVHVNRTMRHLRGEVAVPTAKRTVALPDGAALLRVREIDPRYLHLDSAA